MPEQTWNIMRSGTLNDHGMVVKTDDERVSVSRGELSGYRKQLVHIWHATLGLTV
jgi:hypothetical protein